MRALLRRTPLLFILVVGIFSVYLVADYSRQQAHMLESFRRVRFQKEGNIALLSNLAEELGKKQAWDELRKALEDARKNDRIDFYVLQYQGRALWFGERDDDLSRVDIEYPDVPVFEKGSTILKTTKIGDDYRATIGVEETFEEYAAENRERFFKLFFEEAIYVFFIVLVVAVWAMKDLMLVVREIKRGKKGNFSSMRARSAESDLFLKGLFGYSQAVDQLEIENQKLGRQVLPSLQKEIYSGRKPPYDFNCTMVRTDINGFSLIYNTHSVTDLMSTINDFFDEVSRTVARYGGLVHEFVGDEVIYYFKDDDHSNSFAVALSAVRDINALAERFNVQTTESRGYPFTVKSSLAHGKVRFGPLVNGFTIAGSVLIETVRILSYISEKNENVVYFDGHHARKVQPDIESFERLRVTMKGYKHEIALHQYAAHPVLEDVLKALSLDSVEKLSWYRSDKHLLMILKDLRESAAHRPQEITLRAITNLRRTHIARTDSPFAEILSDWMTELEKNETGEKTLSAVMMLFMNLVPKADFAPQYRKQLQGLLSHDDRRVVANGVEVLTHFDQPLADGALDPKFKKLQKENLRIAANSLVQEGNLELSAAVIKKLSALVRSSKPIDIASGLYALGELSAIHRARDMAYYSAQVEFGSMIEKIDIFAQHATTTVRRQAMIAARKSGHTDLIERIRALVIDSGSDLLKEEFDRHLGTVAESSLTRHKPDAA